MLTPPAGRRGSTSVTEAEVAEAVALVFLEPVWAVLVPLPLPLGGCVLLWELPEVAAAEFEGAAL